MSLLDAQVAALTNGLLALQGGEPEVTITIPGMEVSTYCQNDVPAMQSDLLHMERQRFNRVLRGL